MLTGVGKSGSAKSTAFSEFQLKIRTLGAAERSAQIDDKTRDSRVKEEVFLPTERRVQLIASISALIYLLPIPIAERGHSLIREAN